MMHKPNIATVYNATPPSYAEAMAQSTSTTNVPASMQCPSTMYPQDHSQSFNYSHASAYPYPNNSYSPAQPYNPSYIAANQQTQSSSPYVINATVVAPVDGSVAVRNNTRRAFWVMCVFIIWFIIIVSIFASVFR